jgi:hypothetical protein
VTSARASGVVVAALAAACGGAPPAASPPSNRAEPPAPPGPQQLGSIVVEEYATCTTPHHVRIEVDGLARGEIVVPCAVPPVPHHGVIVTDSSPRVTNGPAFELEPGRHRLSVRDAETGLVDVHEAVFPIYGSLTMPGTPEKDLPADLIVIVVRVDSIRADVVVRANLVLL